ncbi:MAG TPA: PIN domain nuclease [Polyangia bacterium]|nr:PIN domain nuclease [Polyangia bacterium]
MIIVDTTVWIDYFRGRRTAQTRWLDQALGVTHVGLCDLILCEILQGMQSDADAAGVLAQMSSFDLLDTGGVDLAVESARNYRRLRARGHTVRKTIDCLIATLCLREGHELLHNDRDFDPFEAMLGLRVIHP